MVCLIVQLQQLTQQIPLSMHNVPCVRALSSVTESSCDHKHWQISFYLESRGELAIALILFGEQGRTKCLPSPYKNKAA